MAVYNKFGVYFNTAEGNQTIRLPVNPTELTIAYEGETSTYNLIGTGEVIVPRLPKLATVSISSFFPRQEYAPYLSEDSLYSASDYVSFFRSLMETKAVFLFIVNRYDDDKPMFDTSFKAILTSFRITDKGGEPGDIYFEMTVSEYRDTKPERVTVMKKDDATSTTYLVKEKQRDVSPTEFVVGEKVVVNGPIYLEPNSIVPVQASSEIGSVTNMVGEILRLLPPSANPLDARMYVKGIGWVQKADCIKQNVQRTVNSIQNFRTS